MSNHEVTLTPEVQLYDVQVGDDHGRLGRGLLVVVVPLAPQPLGLVPHLQQVLVVLHHHRVLVELAVQVGLGAAPRVRYAEREERLAGGRRHVHAPRVRVLALGRHDALERLRELQVHVHVVLAAHHLQRLDRRHAVRPFQRPDVAGTAAAAAAAADAHRRLHQLQNETRGKTQNKRNYSEPAGVGVGRGFGCGVAGSEKV